MRLGEMDVHICQSLPVLRIYAQMSMTALTAICLSSLWVKTTFHTINLVKSSSLAELVSLSFYSLGQLKLAGEALLIEIMPFPLIWTYGNYNLIEIQATHTFYKTVSALYVGKVISIRSEYKSVYLLMNKLSTALPWIGFIWLGLL